MGFQEREACYHKQQFCSLSKKSIKSDVCSKLNFSLKILFYPCDNLIRGRDSGKMTRIVSRLPAASSSTHAQEQYSVQCYPLASRQFTERNDDKDEKANGELEYGSDSKP